MRNMAIRVDERPPRAVRQHRGKACRDFFSPSNHPRHHPGTVLPGGNGGKPILSYENVFLSFVSNPIIWQTNPIIWCAILSFDLSNPNLSSVILFFSSLPPPRPAPTHFFIASLRTSSTYPPVPSKPHASPHRTHAKSSARVFQVPRPGGVSF